MSRAPPSITWRHSLCPGHLDRVRSWWDDADIPGGNGPGRSRDKRL